MPLYQHQCHPAAEQQCGTYCSLSVTPTAWDPSRDCRGTPTRGGFSRPPAAERWTDARRAIELLDFPPGRRSRVALQVERRRAGGCHQGLLCGSTEARRRAGRREEVPRRRAEGFRRPRRAGRPLPLGQRRRAARPRHRRDGRRGRDGWSATTWAAGRSANTAATRSCRRLLWPQRAASALKPGALAPTFSSATSASVRTMSRRPSCRRGAGARRPVGDELGLLLVGLLESAGVSLTDAGSWGGLRAVGPGCGPAVVRFSFFASQAAPAARWSAVAAAAAAPPSSSICGSSALALSASGRRRAAASSFSASRALGVARGRRLGLHRPLGRRVLVHGVVGGGLLNAGAPPSPRPPCHRSSSSILTIVVDAPARSIEIGRDHPRPSLPETTHDNDGTPRRAGLRLGLLLLRRRRLLLRRPAFAASFRNSGRPPGYFHNRSTALAALGVEPAPVDAGRPRASLLLGPAVGGRAPPKPFYR